MAIIMTVHKDARMKRSEEAGKSGHLFSHYFSGADLHILLNFL